MSEATDRLDVLYLTHNYPRNNADFAGRFLARLAALTSCQTDFSEIGVLAPHHAGAELEETVDGIRVWRFRYAPDADELLAYRGDWGGVSLTGPHGLWATRRFFQAFRKHAETLTQRLKPRVLHAHWWVPAGWIARHLALSTPLIVTLHGSDLRLLLTKRWMRPLARRVFQRAGIITTVSKWLGDSLAQVFPQEAAKIRVAPMPPDDQVFRPAGSPSEANPVPVLLSVTRFTRQKRNHVLLAALATLRAQGCPFRCRLVGDGGSEKAVVQRRIAELKLGDSVEIVGAVGTSQLAEEYRSADLTILPAVDEGFGMAIVEAQLCGCATVGVRSGGICDSIVDGVTGFLARPDDPDDLADAIGRALSDDAGRRRIASQGMRSAQEKFSSQAIVEKFAGWYTELLGTE